VIFLNAGSWAPGSWRVARDIQNLEDFQQFTGAEAFFHYGREHNEYMYAMAGKYLRSGKNPAIVFMHYMNGAWHYRLVPPKEVQLGIVQTVASGANPWLAFIHSALESQPTGNEPPKELFTFFEEKKEYFTDLESIAEVAVLFSANTGQYYLSHIEGLYTRTGSGKEEDLAVDLSKRATADWPARKRECESLLTDGCQGFFHALSGAHIPFDIVLDRYLTPEYLSRYRVLVLPDGACLSADAVATITDFVAKGGGLLASFEAGFYDQRGQYGGALLDVLGIAQVDGIFPVGGADNYIEATADHWGFPTGTLYERGSHALKVKPLGGVDTPAFFLIPPGRPYIPLEGRSQYPALLRHGHGKGQVIYFPEAMGVFFTNTRMPSAEQRIAHALRELLPIPRFEAHAPRTVTLDVYRQADARRILVHLVNNTVDGHPVNEFTPVRGILLRLRCDTEPRTVTALREGRHVDAAYRDGFLEMRLPQLDMYEVLAIQW